MPIDRDGYYFVDRSGEAFQYILEFMRTGQLLEPEEDFLRQILRDDMAFYKISAKKRVDLKRFRGREKKRVLPQQWIFQQESLPEDI